jgi:4-hydroxybenzoate polyprenyltransferase
MEQFKLFINLTRLEKPIGYMLLFWPCSWGLTLAYDFSDYLKNYFLYLVLFLSGAVLMRSAGCIINDIVDRKFDKKVSRTKNRPIASGKVSVTQGIIYTLILCSLAFLVLINFNHFTIILALSSMPLAFTYPLMKRYTYWPQFYLGVTFNYGLLLGWTSIFENFSIEPIILYLGAIFWTLGYDTIYGYQDIKDDEVIGIKSTSIKFKSNPHLFINFCYMIFFISLIILGFFMDFKLTYFVMITLTILYYFYFSLFKLDIHKSNSCLNAFKSNNFLGLAILIILIINKMA